MFQSSNMDISTLVPIQTTLPESNNSMEENRGDPLAEGLKIIRMFYMIGVFPLAILGILLNGVVFWVWMSSQKRKPMILLFQSLAVWDGAYLLFEIARVVSFLKHDHGVSMNLAITRSLFQTGSIYTTLFIAVLRWLAVWKPFTARRITWRHALAMSFVILLWCGATSGAYGYLKKKRMDENWMSILVEVVRHILPVIVLMVFSASLVWVVCKKRSRELKGSARGAQKTTMTVLCIAGCSFVAYPVTFAAEAILVLDTNTDIYSKCWVCIGIILGCSHLLQAINSGINFVFYLFVSTKFRGLLRKKFVNANQWPRRKSSASSTTSRSTNVELADQQV